ncbi:MAG: hypothetical protein ABIX01_16615 [Chitinophagaceae bacterium]
MKHLIKYIGLCWVAISLSYVGNAQPNITRVEYYIDTDPGFGLGTAITTSGTATEKNGSFTLDLTALSNGVHIVGARTQDANGAWSHDNKWLFAKLGGALLETTVPNLVRSEYYVNTDPGFGLGTAITTTGSATDKNGSFTLDITGYPLGVTIVGVRSQDANKAWSHDNKWLFAKVPPENTLPTITRLEYYLDNDPGFGKATPVAITNTNNLPGIVLNANITGLANGKHKIYYRTQDANGAWSHDNVDSFTLSPYNVAPAIVVNSVTKTTLCARDSFKVGYHATGSYTAGNIFNVEISDASGVFAATPPVLGSVVSAALGGVITCYLPAHFAEGSAYKLRVSSSNTALTGITSQYTLTIHDRPFTQTITGRTIVNGTYTWPYTVPAAPGSQWNWTLTGGLVSSGQNTNTANITWSQPGSPVTTGNMYVIETSQYGCVGDSSTLGPLTIYKLNIKDTVPVTACKTDILAVKTGSTGAFEAGNNLIAELSDVSGSFASPVSTASVAASGNGVNQLNTINLTIPFGIPNGTGYRIRVRGTIPSFVGDTSAAISIVKPDIGADLTRTYCITRGYNLLQHFTDPALTYTYFNQAFVSQPRPDSVEAGTYQIIGTNAQGCTDTASVTLTSNPTPILGADTTVYHVCPGETTNILPFYNTTGLTAVWNTPTPTLAIPGTYRLIVTNGFGCTDTAFAFVILETATWTGTVSSDWHTPGNWSTGKVPTDRTHVIITGLAPNLCIISAANAQAASIQVRNGATVQTTNNRIADVKGKCLTLPQN